MSELREDNGKRLEEMRRTVDEKRKAHSKSDWENPLNKCLSDWNRSTVD